MKFILCLLCFLHPVFGHTAAKVVGNGGNALVCQNGTVEMLDYYEVRLNGGTLKFNPVFNNYTQKLQDLFNRWRAVAPRRIALYEKWLAEFPSEAGIYSGISIPAIPDTGSVAIPIGCELKPIAFQRPDSELFSGVKRYTIIKDLWDRMPEDQKAGLVLHEFIYREAIDALHENSFPTRILNGFFASQTPKVEPYAIMISQMPLLWVEYGGLLVILGKKKCPKVQYPDYTDKDCRIIRLSSISANKLELRVSEVFGDVDTDLLTIEFAGAFPNALNDGAHVRYNVGDYTGIDVTDHGKFRVKRVVFRDQLSLGFQTNCIEYDMNLCGSVELVRGQLLIGGLEYPQERYFDLDPRHSWLQQDSDQISGISRVQTQNGLAVRITTDSGAIWEWDRGLLKYARIN